MQEIEVKILGIDIEEIRTKLKELGATKVFEGEMIDINYDYPDKRIANSKQLLRIRTKGEVTELCFKGKNNSEKFKTQEETEVTVNNFQDTCIIFEKIGLIKTIRSKKHREAYQKGSIHYEIDTYQEIPTYLEIEAPTEEQVVSAVKELGYTMDQTTNMHTGEIIEHYGKNS